MPIYRIGRERESLMYSGEAYKKGVRKYLESLGYSETTDSYVEGHIPDMIFYNRDVDPGREFWIEAKAKKVSLYQKDFCKGLMDYLHIWLNQDSSQKFKFKFFIQEVSKPQKWNLLFKPPIDKVFLHEWLNRAKAHVSEELIEDIQDKRDEELIPFFQETEIYIGPAYRLEIAAEEKYKTSALSPSRKAESLLEESERRNVLVEQKTNILMNLMELELPEEYLRAELIVDKIEKIWIEISESIAPPFAFDGRYLYSFCKADDLGSFSKLFKKDPEYLNTDLLIKDNPQQLSWLLNFHIDKLARCRGLRKYHDIYFLTPRYNDLEGLEDRLEKSVTGKLKKVARPMYETVETKEGETENLNFVFHWGVTLEAKYLWDRLFVQILPIRHFTIDGKVPLDSEHKKRLERKYRNPLYNRNPKFLSWTIFWKYYIFDCPLYNQDFSCWFNNFVFGDLLETSIIGSPEAIDKNQRMIIEYGDDEDDD